MVSLLSQCFVPECCPAQPTPLPGIHPRSTSPCLLRPVAVKVLLKGEAVAQGQLELPAETMQALEEESLVMSRIRWAWCYCL